MMSFEIYYSYYFENKMNSDLKRKAYQNHLIWIIQNRFDAEVLGERIAHVSFHDSSFYNKIKRLWLKQTETHHKNAAVLSNGAEFFLGAGIEIQTDTSKKIINIITNFDKPYLYPELDLAEKLLKKAQNIQPDNTKWSRKLAKYYEQMTKYKSCEERTKAAEKALEQLEITLDQTDNEKKRFILISRTVNVAFQADKLAEAKSYAQELLELSPKYSEDKHYYGKAVHQGNLILGKIALKENDLEKATKYLIEAGKTTGGPQLNYLGPDTTLAKQLLAAGERKAVIQYFRLCANFWKRGSDRLKSWIAAIEGGDIPVFDLNLEGMNTAIFTAGLNERNRPIDNIEEISITADRIYIFTYWHDISPEKHDYLCNMYDAAERLVFQHKMDINPQKDKYYTWTYHSLNKFAEKPGEWRFEIYLDDKKEIEKYLVVLNKVGQPFAKNTVRIAGKVTNARGKPPVMAHVHLTSFHGNYRHTFRTVAVGKDGLYSMEVYWPGLYRFFVTAVNNGHTSIPIIIDDETQEIGLDVKLAPLVYNDEFDVVRIVGDWNHPYDFTDADTMQKQADGTFVYERQVEADTIFYQLIGVT